MEDLETKLILGRWITPEQLSAAKQEAAATGKPIWPILVKLGYLSNETIFIFFAQESGIPYVSIPDYKLNREVVLLLDERFCRDNLVLPLFLVKGVLFVACNNPLDPILIDSMASLTGLSIETLITCAHAITRALDECYGPEDNVFIIEQFLVK